MRLEILNSLEIDEWLWSHRGHGCIGIKGDAPVGSTYDGAILIERPVNIAWRDQITGEEILIEYGKS